MIYDYAFVKKPKVLDMRKGTVRIFYLFIIIIVVIVGVYLTQIYWISKSQNNSNETYLLTSESPDEEYLLKAYKTEPGATVDFSIKVYLVENKTRKLIYNAYHESYANIVWMNNDIVSINGIALDLSKEETYDWRKP